MAFASAACAARYNTTDFIVNGRTMAPAISDGELVTMQQSRPPRRFDLVAYEKFWEDNQIVVGRVIGLPGERVDIVGPNLRVNGVPIDDWRTVTPASYRRSFELASDEYVILQDQCNIGDDSHSRGPVKAEFLIASAAHE